MVSLSYEVVLVDVNDEKLWSEGHLIRRWFEGIDNELVTAITAEAPHSAEPGGTKNYPPRPNKSSGSPGDLRRGIHSSEPNRIGARALETKIISSAPHTMWVLFGTTTIQAQARSSRGTFGVGLMRLPAQPWIGRKRRGRVAGQEPNNFFERGYDIVAANHSSLR